MSSIHNSRPELSLLVAAAQLERAEAMQRATYLAVDAIGRLGSRTLGLLRRGSRQVATALAEWRARRRALQALQKLDDRLLHDIGLTRDDLWAAASGRPLAPAESEPATTLRPVIDVALSEQAIGGCNDNARGRRAA